MRLIPAKLRKEIDADPYYKKCARSDEGNCSKTITIEHAIIYGGRQLNELWALLPICTYHHAVNEHQDGGDMNKEKHVWIALNRATDEELKSISKAVDYLSLRDRLNEKYSTHR